MAATSQSEIEYSPKRRYVGDSPLAVMSHPWNVSAEPSAVQYSGERQLAGLDCPPWTIGEAALLEVTIDGHPLTTALLVKVSYHGGYYEIEHEELALFGTGRTQAEAVEDFISFLIADFRHYALANRGDLNPGAQQLADTYRRLFGMRA